MSEEEYNDDREEEGFDQKRHPPSYPMRDQSHGAMALLTNPSSILYDFELFLRGFKEVEGDLIKTERDALCNESGVNSIINILGSAVNKSNPLSNLGEHNIINIYNTLKGDMIYILMFKRKSVGVKRQDRNEILGNAMRLVEGFLLRGLEEGERKFWKGSTTEHIIKSDTTRSGQSGGFSLNPLTGFKKK